MVDYSARRSGESLMEAVLDQDNISKVRGSGGISSIWFNLGDYECLFVYACKQLGVKHNVVPEAYVLNGIKVGKLEVAGPNERLPNESPSGHFGGNTNQPNPGGPSAAFYAGANPASHPKHKQSWDAFTRQTRGPFKR